MGARAPALERLITPRRILHALSLTAALAWLLSSAWVQTEDPATSAPNRLYFLADGELPDGTMLLLTPPAMEGYGDADAPVFRAVRDTAALRAAAPQVWVEDAPGDRFLLTALSILFLSPPTNGINDDFARLVYPDGTTRSTYVFHPGLRDGTSAPPHNLAGLMDLSEPVFERVDAMTDDVAYAALVARIDSDPNLFAVHPLPPTAPDLAYPTLSDLSFPTLLLAEDAVTEARITAEIARAKARFAAMFGPAGGTYAPLSIYNQDCTPPFVTEASGNPVLVDGQPLYFTGFKTITLTAKLRSDLALIDQIAGAAATFNTDRPAEDSIDPGFDAACAALLTQNLGPVDPSDYALDVGCWEPALRVFWPRENVTYVPYYEILPGAAP